MNDGSRMQRNVAVASFREQNLKHFHFHFHLLQYKTATTAARRSVARQRARRCCFSKPSRVESNRTEPSLSSHLHVASPRLTSPTTFPRTFPTNVKEFLSTALTHHTGTTRNETKRKRFAARAQFFLFPLLCQLDLSRLDSTRLDSTE